MNLVVTEKANRCHFRTAEHHHSIPQQRSKQQLVYSSETEGDDEEIYPNRSFYCEEDEYDSEMDDFIDDSMVDDFQREDFEETLRLVFLIKLKTALNF